MSSIPKVSLTVEIEGQPQVKLEAADADLDSLVEWLSSPKVARQLTAIVALLTGQHKPAE